MKRKTFIAMSLYFWFKYVVWKNNTSKNFGFNQFWEEKKNKKD